MARVDGVGRLVGRDGPEDLARRVRAGQVNHLGPGCQRLPGDVRLVRLDRHQAPGRPQFADHRQQLLILGRRVLPGGVGQGRFRSDIDDIGSLRQQHPSPLNRRSRGQTHALAIPGVRGEIDNPHDCGRRIKGKLPAADGEFLDASLGGGAVLLKQSGKVFESQHGTQVKEDLAAIQALHGFGPRESRAPRIRVQWLWLTAGKI